MKKRIVFDAGGVLFDDGSKKLLRFISDQGDISFEDLEAYYRQNLHVPLMRGESKECRFWPEILAYAKAPLENEAAIKEYFLNEILTNMPAVEHIGKWADQAELWILSNHRHEWLNSRLENADIARHFDTILISSQIGTRKPEEASFAHLTKSDADQTIYIDDKQHNLDEAAKLGYDTLLADRDGKWIEALDTWV